MGMLESRAAVITGGAQGIGLSIASTFAEHGAKVVLADRDEATAKAAAKELSSTGADALAVACDVTDPDAVDATVATCIERHGSVDILVNNAGIIRDLSLKRMRLEDFRAVIDVHLTGAWLMTRAAAGPMREQGRGAVINMSSISGKVGNPGQTNYSAAKAGLIGLTKSAAKELGRHGIRVNAIQPGLVLTAMTRDLDPAVLESKLVDVPLGRAAEPEDVADVALFLASDMSRYMTGCVLEVTGGRHM